MWVAKTQVLIQVLAQALEEKQVKLLRLPNWYRGG